MKHAYLTLRLPQDFGSNVGKLKDRRLISVLITVILFLMIAVASTTAPAQQERAQPDRQETAILTLEKPVQSQLAGPEPQTLRLSLSAGQFVQVVVTCRDADIGATLFGPNGAMLRTATNTTSVELEASLSWFSGTDGLYRLEIRSLGPTTKGASYVAKIVQLRPGSSKDEELVAGELAYDAVDGILQPGTPDRLDVAFQKLGETISFAQRAEDFALVSRAKRRQAFILRMQSDLDRARILCLEAKQLIQSKFGLADLKLAPTLWDLADIEAAIVGTRESRAAGLARAKTLYEQGLEIVRKRDDSESLLAAHGSSRMTELLLAQGDYAAAREASEHASRIYVRRYGPESVPAARSYALVARTLQRLDQLPAAVILLEQGLRIYEGHFGAKSPALIGQLNLLINVLSEAERFSEALAKAEAVLTIIQDQEGVKSRGAINGLLSVARALIAKGDFEAARSRLDQAIKTAEELDGVDAVGIEILLMEKLKTYRGRGDYVAGKGVCERALKIGRQNDSVLLGSSLMSCGRFDIEHRKKNEGRAEYEDAVRVFVALDGTDSRRATSARQELSESFIEEIEDKDNRAISGLRDVVKTLEGIHGLHHPALIEPLDSLARAFIYKGFQSDAVVVVHRAEKILKENQLEDKPIAITTLTRLAFIQSSQGESKVANETMRRVLKIFEKNPGHRVSTEEMFLRNSLAELLIVSGDLTEARALLDKSISLGKQQPELRFSALPAYVYMAKVLITQGDPDTAAGYIVNMRADSQELLGSGSVEALTFLLPAAGIAAQVGKHAEAREFGEKAVQIVERELGREHFLTARVLAIQAIILMSIGDKLAAEAAATKAEEVFSKSKTEHFTRAAALGMKGELLIDRGEFLAGRELIEKAVQILSRELGAENYMTSAGIGRLGWLSYRQREIPRAQEYFLKSASASEQHIRNVLPMLSLAEQHLFLEMSLPEQISGMLTVCREGLPLLKAYDLMLRWKGSLVDSLHKQSVLNRAGRSASNTETIRRLTQLRGEISAWYQQVNSIRIENWRERNEKLTAEKEALERDLNRTANRDVVADPLADGLKSLQASLQKDEVFLDFYLYDFRKSGGAVEERYAAILTGAADDPKSIDLGSSKRINDALQAWRDEVLVKSSAQKQWDDLAALLWRPLADALPANVRKVWVSPDSELARIPWQLLPGTDPKTAGVLLAQADSARELARLRRPRALSDASQPKTVLLVGDIDFDAKLSPNDQLIRDKRLTAVTGSSAEIFFISALGKKFGASLITKTRSQANKNNVVESMQKARFVHLATHGFFAQANPEPPQTESRFTAVFSEPTAPNARNPLVESGIALAGANVIDPATNSRRGLLSAEEILDLDLSSCELITLSACDTGRGREVTGQGVMGLRAAVIAGGARSMLMSLWKVPDEATVKFMQVFYSNLWLKGMSKSQALLKAQEEVRNDPSGKYSQPINWAGWILVGEAW